MTCISSHVTVKSLKYINLGLPFEKEDTTTEAGQNILIGNKHETDYEVFFVPH